MTLGQRVTYSIVGGLVLTLLTALLPFTAFIGTLAHGYPLPWLSQPIWPQGGPMTVLWNGLILDIIVWTVLVFYVIKLYQVLRKDGRMSDQQAW